MNGAVWRSALVAALFAWHPLHVESVAWVAERKDVLSTLFWLLTMWAYFRYAELKSSAGDLNFGLSDIKTRWYGLALVFFALGMMAKPMLVTLPFVLLLLDYWPLSRFSGSKHEPSGTNQGRGTFNKINADFSLLAVEARRLVTEKIPFFIVALAASVTAYIAQNRTGAVLSLDLVPWEARLTNALVSYARYLGKTFWPADLAAFYPHPGAWPWWQALGAVLLLIIITLFAICLRQRSAAWAVGWFWFLGTLVPVIGLVQVGSHAMADRYTYVPLLGLFVAIVWGGSESLIRYRIPAALFYLIGGVAAMACAGAARQQLWHWRDGEAVFRRAVEVTRNNALAHYNLAFTLAEKNRHDDAIQHYREATRIEPQIMGFNGHYNVGALLARQGRWQEAGEEFALAARIRPQDPDTLNNLGYCLLEAGQIAEAINRLNSALKIRPDFIEARFNLATALERAGNKGDAAAELKKVIGLDPAHAEAHLKLGDFYYHANQFENAEAHYEQAVQAQPDNAAARVSLGLMMAREGKAREASRHFQQAIALAPNWPLPKNELAWILATHPDEQVRNGAEAVRLAERACELTEWKRTAFLGTLDAAYAANGQFEKAIATVQRTLSLAESEGNDVLAKLARERLSLYQNEKPFAMPTPDRSPP